MYRKPLSIFLVLMAVMVACPDARRAAAQEPPAGAEVPAAAVPAAGAAAAPAKPAARDYNKIKAAGVLATPKPVLSVGFSPNGAMLAAVTYTEALLWDTKTGTPLRAITPPKGGFTRFMAWSPDSNTLALAGGGMAGAVTLWDAQSGNMTLALGQRAFINAIAYSPDGSSVAAASTDRKVRLWSVADGTEQAVLDGPLFGISALSFSPDGTTLYAVGGGTGKLLQAAEGDEADMGGMTGAMTPGTYESMTEVTSWSLATRKRLSQTTLSGGGPYSRLSPDGTLLAVIGSHAVQRRPLDDGPPGRLVTFWPANSARLWIVPQGGEAGKPDAYLENHMKHPTATPRDRMGAAWSPDGKVGAFDDFLWNGGEAPVPLPRGDLTGFTSLAFSPDGGFLAGGGATGVQIWMVPQAQATVPRAMQP